VLLGTALHAIGLKMLTFVYHLLHFPASHLLLAATTPATTPAKKEDGQPNVGSTLF
jgi:hypothetical protein